MTKLEMEQFIAKELGIPAESLSLNANIEDGELNITLDVKAEEMDEEALPPILGVGGGALVINVDALDDGAQTVDLEQLPEISLSTSGNWSVAGRSCSETDSPIDDWFDTLEAICAENAMATELIKLLREATK